MSNLLKMDSAELKEIQDAHLEAAKGFLLQENSLHPIGLVFAPKSHMYQLREMGLETEIISSLTNLSDASSREDTTVSVVIDLHMDWQRLFQTALLLFPESKETFLRLAEIGGLSAPDDIEATCALIMKSFFCASGLDEKDMMQGFLKHVCSTLDASAVIYISEAWFRSASSKEEHEKLEKEIEAGGLHKDPVAEEAILCSMETLHLTRVLMVPIHRDPGKDRRDDGDITGFGEVLEISDSEKGSTLEGRMLQFLPIPKAKASA